MKEHQIIFNGQMVRTILENRKTQTRRPINPQPDFKSATNGFILPYQIGHRLWVKETFFLEWPNEDPPENMRDCRVVYKASEPNYITSDMREFGKNYKWSPSIHMPRWASRMTLEITDIRVEQIQDISETDAISEGLWINGFAVGVCHPHSQENCRRCRFKRLWDSIYSKKFSWDSNPWVWVTEFKRVGV